MHELEVKIEETLEYFKKEGDFSPDIGIILGSGLGPFAQELDNQTVISYEDIPNFPLSTVDGHSGNLIFGHIKGKKIVVMQGRFHYYEGYFMREITFPVRVMHGLGVKNLIISNAAGGIGNHLKIGDIMIITDHINLMGNNPLIGHSGENRNKFLDMSKAYNPELLRLAKEVSVSVGIKIKKGVLAAVSGPCYETLAEVEMLKRMGADAVCMSTIPEVIMAVYLGIKVLGISLITNLHGEIEGVFEHQQVIEAARQQMPKFSEMLKAIIEKIEE